MNMNNVTNRDLAKWLALGQGEWMHSPSNSGTVYMTYKYNEIDADKPITRNSEGQGIVVRKWHDKEWHEPTDKYLYGTITSLS